MDGFQPWGLQPLRGLGTERRNVNPYTTGEPHVPGGPEEIELGQNEVPWPFSLDIQVQDNWMDDHQYMTDDEIDTDDASCNENPPGCFRDSVSYRYQ